MAKINLKFCLAFLLGLFANTIFAENILITDSRGKLSFIEPPKRVVVINWTLTEQLLALGVTPVGVADIKGYKSNGYQQIIPNSVVDIGSRTAPDYEKIKALKPDIILVGYSQKPLLFTLENLGTVVYFRNFSRRYDNQQRAQDVYLEMAKLFAKTDFAQQRIKQSDENIAVLQKKLAAHFSEKLSEDVPKLTMLFADKNHAWLYEENSLPFYAAQQLGLQITTSSKPSQFGLRKIPYNKLPKDLGCIIVFQNYLSAASLPDVITNKADCLYEMPNISTFGGAFAVELLAENLVKVLINK